MPTLVRWEIVRLFRVGRTWLATAAAIGVGFFVAYAYGHWTMPSGMGFGWENLGKNGFYVPVAALTVSLPSFLPLLVAAVAGDLVAGERQLGTWSTLLILGIDPVRMFVAKWLVGLGFVSMVTGGLVLASFIGGAAFYGLYPPLLPSGSVCTPWHMGLILGGMAVYTGLGLLVVMTLALVWSTLVRHAVSAVLATLVTVFAMTVVDAIPMGGAVSPYLFVTYFSRLSELLSTPPVWPDLERGVLVYLLYLSGLWAIGIWMIPRRD